MAGCTRRCRDGLVKLVQSVQRLLSGTLTKGTTSIMERREDPLLQFLQDRGTEEEILNKLKSNKIDSSVIALMSEEDMAKYIPHYGDRLVCCYGSCSLLPQQSLWRFSSI
ncbi:hypothetical protein NHX12_010609 [Muraenolepis orangiensis]|uniref:Uncharacterized protein n=1 Tax=Muraenolepis orangiensis TaxID=630683 RepID=A0A9Q0I7F8_9TELE|nr:hypothetical protein NHX12_010609 [Muraenolepis orangiensis]